MHGIKLNFFGRNYKKLFFLFYSVKFFQLYRFLFYGAGTLATLFKNGALAFSLFLFSLVNPLDVGLVNLNLRGFCSDEMEDMGLKSHWCRC